MNITKADLKRAKRRQIWSLGNQVLYDLCRAFPLHNSDDAIIAKVLLIGRVYAAAIERRKVIGTNRGDDFYTKTVAPKIRASGIDKWLGALPPPPLAVEGATAKVLKVHAKVTALFSKISRLDKRSLASKYLHFHRPDLFFIYDSRALDAARAVAPALRRRTANGHDPVYSSFFRRCLHLKQTIANQFHTDLTPRQLDDLLIVISERLAN